MAREMARTRSLEKLSVRFSRLPKRILRGSLLDVTERRTHHIGRDSEDILYGLLSPSQFRDDLVVGKRRQRRMTPSVHADLMLSHVLGLKGCRELDDTRAHNEEGRFELFFVEILEEIRSVEAWPIIVCETPGEGVRTFSNILLARTPSASPPAPGWVVGNISVVAATTYGRSA